LQITRDLVGSPEESETVVKTKVGSGDLQAHAEVAGGARISKDVISTFSSYAAIGNGKGARQIRSVHQTLQEERRLARPSPAAQETPFGIYGPPTPYTPSYF